MTCHLYKVLLKQEKLDSSAVLTTSQPWDLVWQVIFSPYTSFTNPYSGSLNWMITSVFPQLITL